MTGWKKVESGISGSFVTSVVLDDTEAKKTPASMGGNIMRLAFFSLLLFSAVTCALLG